LLAGCNVSLGEVLDKIAIPQTDRVMPRPTRMPCRDTEQDQTRFSVAEDVGGIEVMYAKYRKYRVPHHMHDAYSIGVSLRGGLAFDHRGSKYTAPSGVISAIEPYQVHNAYAAGEHGWEFIAMLFPLDVVRSAVFESSGADSLPCLPKRVIYDVESARRLVMLYDRLENSRDLLERQSTTVVTLTEFFQRHSTARRETSRLSRERDAVRRARELLQDCYAERISLDQLSTHAALSPFYFLRIFRDEVGLTPHAYLNQIRIREAKRKLAAGVSPAQAALECGFYDQSHLARVFRGATGVTPGRYQSAFGVR
jgi:AraC-like DNA-binding protein